MSDEVFAKFRAEIMRRALVVAGDKILVACSGGPDSMVLVHLLLDLKREVPFEVVVAHFNHRLRRAADGDERFVRNAARSLGLRAVVGRRDVKTYARTRKLNIEEAARTLRYAFLEKAASRTGATKIATGHTLNDQAETVLIRLLRGSGTRGLAGIRTIVRGRVIRPLLGISRREVEAYKRGQGLASRTDRTNFNRRLLRNKVRLELIPFLEKKFAPDIVSILGRTASILEDEDEIIETVVREKAKRLVPRRGGRFALNARALAGESTGLARRLVRHYFELVRGDLRRISFGDAEAVRALADGDVRTLPGGLRLRRKRGYIAPAASPSRTESFSYRWEGDWPLTILEAGLTLAGTKIRPSAERNLRFDDRRRCYCDENKLNWPLTVRSRQDGDRFRPFGAPGRKKLKELLRAKRVPLPKRDRLPVVCSGDDIVWVPGLPVAEKFKVTPVTSTVFSIELK